MIREEESGTVLISCCHNSCSRGVMATRLTSNQKIVGSTPTVSALFLTTFFNLENETATSDLT